MVTYEAVSPSEFKNGQIEILYGVHESPFGLCLIGVTKRGICHLSFIDTNNATEVFTLLHSAWPKAHITRDDIFTKSFISSMFGSKKSKRLFHLLIRGTHFQIKVWEALLTIPRGKTVSYKDIAYSIGSPKAVRAVGTACGKNSIGFLIPCHRVLTSDGRFGGYRWGVTRKEALLRWEDGRNNKNSRASML